MRVFKDVFSGCVSGFLRVLIGSDACRFVELPGERYFLEEHHSLAYMIDPNALH